MTADIWARLWDRSREVLVKAGVGPHLADAAASLLVVGAGLATAWVVRRRFLAVLKAREASRGRDAA